MKNLHIFLIFLVMGLFVRAPAHGNEDGTAARGYADRSKYAVIIGRISNLKQIESAKDDMGGAKYYVDIYVIRNVRNSEFNLKKFSTDMNIYDIEYINNREIILVLQKTSSWKVVFWKQADTLLCLDEEKLLKDGWLDMAVDKPTENCITL